MRSSRILCSVFYVALARSYALHPAERVGVESVREVTISQAAVSSPNYARAEASKGRAPCPKFTRGSYDIEAYQLYPENMDWDANLCQVYIGILFNASFGIYNPYRDRLDAIEFPGITHNPDFHLGGVGWDRHSGKATLIIGQGNAFNTAGANISGDNFLLKFDPARRGFLWTVNLTALTRGAWGGFNDMTVDPAGNTYVCGTYPASIVKVDPAGRAPIAWVPPVTADHTRAGYSGIASHGNAIVVLDSSDGSLWRLDAADAHRGTPVPLPRTPDEPIIGGDSIHLPVLLGGCVMLVAEHLRGVSVLRSRDGAWTAAEYLGLVPNAPGLPAGALVVSTAQIADRLYIVNDWFGDPVVPGTQAGNKTAFPMVDITSQVQALIDAAGR